MTGVVATRGLAGTNEDGVVAIGRFQSPGCGKMGSVMYNHMKGITCFLLHFIFEVKLNPR